MKSKMLTWFYDTKVYDYYRLIFVRVPERLKRAVQFAIFGWGNYDYDYSALHDLTLYKLKRMLYCFENFGHHSEECEHYKPKMKSLKLAIKLIEKYKAGDTMFMDLHEKKWGPVTFWSEKAEISESFGQLYVSKSKRPNAVTEEEIKQERKELLEAYDLDERLNDKKLDLAYKIIIKYNRYWWD